MITSLIIGSYYSGKIISAISQGQTCYKRDHNDLPSEHERKLIRWITNIVIYIVDILRWRFVVMMFNATFNNISGVPRENHRPALSHWHILSCCIQYTSPWAEIELATLVVTGTDCKGSGQSNYHTITTTTAAKLHCNFALSVKYLNKKKSHTVGTDPKSKS